MGTWGADGVRVVNANWNWPVTWDRIAQQTGDRRFVFPSLCDVFEDFEGHVLTTAEAVVLDCLDCGHSGPAAIHAMLPPHCHECGSGLVQHGTLDGTRRRFFRLIDATPNLTWLLLTKRPQNVRRMWTLVCDQCNKPQEYDGSGLCSWRACPETGCCDGKQHASNRQKVWLGVSVSDQQTADELIPQLVRLRDLVPVLFVSCEPLLGPVNLKLATKCDYNCAEHQEAFCPGTSGKCIVQHALDWVIVGGESGPRARPCEVSWIDALLGQCREASVPCFVKQLGTCAMRNATARLYLDDNKGGDPEEWPTYLRVREMPELEAQHAPQ
jgi:protein gp37